MVMKQNSTLPNAPELKPNFEMLSVGLSFLWFGFKLELEFGAKEAMVSVIVCTEHHSSMKNIFQVTLVHKNIVNDIADSVCDNLMFCAEP